MFISIHLTTFCQAKSGWLERAITSILNQSYEEFELICYDDASYDGTADILERFANADRRVRVITATENVNSVSKSLGKCFLERSPKADAITWMFDDNVLEPDALQVLVDNMVLSGADVVYGQTKIMMPGGADWLIGAREPNIIASSFDTTSADVPNAGILINQKLFDRSGWYDPSIILRRSCDWDLFRRIWASTDKIVKIDHVCAVEYGELSQTSLRNSFDTSFPLMQKYVAIRDNAKFRLDVLSAVSGPSDMIPKGPWSPEELIYIYSGFVRYFVSIGKLERAADWAKEIIKISSLQDDLVIRNLTNRFSKHPDVLNAVLAGMFAQRIAPETLALTVVAPSYGINILVADYIVGRIRASKSAVTKILWKGIFQFARLAWRLRPR